jgi:hypothetical protein
MLASMYGERSVLAILPLCIKDKVVTWFYGLEDEVSAIIADSIDEWKIQLIRRFHTNPSQALVKADRMHLSGPRLTGQRSSGTEEPVRV